MFKFPEENTRRTKWTVNCRRDNWIPGKHAQLCSDHFEESQFEQARKDGWKRLRLTAIPTLFNVPKHLAPETVSLKRVKGIGSPKPNTLLSSHLNSAHSDHFEESQFEQARKDGWKRLRLTAIPTLFNVPKHLAPETVSLKRVKGIGSPKPNTLLSSHLNSAHSNEDNAMAKKIKELEAENAKLKNELAKLKEELSKRDEALNFLSEEQQKISKIKRSSIKSWSQEGIIRALKLRFALGKFGYEYLRSTGYPSPCYSTLNRRMQGIQMNFGILDSFCHYLKIKIDLMSVNDRWCTIIIDEMEISKIKDFDTSKKCFVGGVTLGPKLVPGNKYTVVLLRGLKSKWKQVIAHEITGPSTPAPDMKNLLDKVIETGQELGLVVKAMSSDMGNNNRGMWKECGVCVSKDKRDTVYRTENGDIHTVADVPHLLKNLRSAFLSRPIYLPEDVCKQQGLQTTYVSSGYIKSLWIKEIEDETSLRSLHHLGKEHLFPSHFNKMNVGTAVQLFSVKTAAALEKAVRLKQVHKDALTTAWFIRLVQEWFEMMTARHVKKGITEKNCTAKLQFLNDVIYIAQNMKLGKSWKPLQTGIILSTVSTINLVKEALASGFKYFLPGRLSQDALENVFSQIRKRAGRKPTALKARRALKLVCVSQFISDLKDVNYFADNDHHLFDMPRLQDVTEDNHRLSSPKQNRPLTCSNENDIYFIAGATLKGILKQKMCDACMSAAQNAVDQNEENIPEYLKYLTKYSDMGGLKYPSSGFYRICRETEREVQHYKDEWVKDESKIDQSTFLNVKERCKNVEMPICCNLKEKIIRYYLIVRCKGIIRHMENKSAYEKSYSSPSLANKM